MKTKQEVIQEAYGEAWECLKDHVDENGWINALRESPLGDTSPLKNGFPLAEIEIRHFFNLFLWRPNLLRGLESNNGWIKSKVRLPQKGIQILHCIEGKYVGIMDSEDFLIYHLHNGSEFNSHWKPFQEIKPPLY